MFGFGKVKVVLVGFYFYGGVGCGKFMLMDFFFSDVLVVNKCCVYFYVFMFEIYDVIVEWCGFSEGDCKCCLNFVCGVGDDLIVFVVWGVV